MSQLNLRLDVVAVVNVIGVGVVGFSTARVLQRFGNDVRVFDADQSRQLELEQMGFRPVVDDREDDITIICVREGNIQDALAIAPPESLWVVRSTTQPGQIQKLSVEFDHHIVHLPEFLREATSFQDAISPHFVLIGQCCREHGEQVEDLFSPLLAPVYRADPATTEMVKLATNAYLSNLISFWNQVHLICAQVGVNSTVVGKIAAQDPRVSSYGAVMHGEPFGGFCLPKDLDAIIALAQRHTVPAPLLEAVRAVNEHMGRRGIPGDTIFAEA